MATDADTMNRLIRERWLTDFEGRTEQLVLDLAEDRPLEDSTIQKWIKDYLFLRSVEEEMNTEPADTSSSLERKIARAKTDFQTKLLTEELQKIGLASPVILDYLKREHTVVESNGLYAARNITPTTLQKQALSVGGTLTTAEAIYVVLDALTTKLESIAKPDTLRSRWQKLLVQATRV